MNTRFWIVALCCLMAVAACRKKNIPTQTPDLDPNQPTVETNVPDIDKLQPRDIVFSRTYETNLFSISIAEGWSTEKTFETRVNIMNGDFILYVNPDYRPAGGPEGGRFSSLAQGAPGVDAVITVHPSDPCGFSETTQLENGLFRTDWYIGPAVGLPEYCRAPTTDKTVWYFSYVHSGDGYGGKVTAVSPNVSNKNRLFAVTLTHRATTPDDLPAKDSPTMKRALIEMYAMAQTLKFK